MKLTLSREKKSLFHTKESNTFQEGWLKKEHRQEKFTFTLFLRANTDDFQVVSRQHLNTLIAGTPLP